MVLPSFVPTAFLHRCPTARSHPTPRRRGGRVQLMAVPMPDSDYYNEEKGGC